MTDRELLTQVLSEVRYIKERQDDFIDQSHQWRIDSGERESAQDLSIADLRNQVNGLVWMAGKVALAAAALLNGVAAVCWLAFKTWFKG